LKLNKEEEKRIGSAGYLEFKKLDFNPSKDEQQTNVRQIMVQIFKLDYD